MKFQDFFKPQNRSSIEHPSFPITSGALADYLGWGGKSGAGVNVNEATALGLTAVYSAVSHIAGTIATLPMKTYKRLEDGSKQPADSFLSSPGGPEGLTPSAWKQLVMVHLLLHGNAYLVHIYNQGGALIGLQPVHPLAVQVEVNKDNGRRLYTITLADGSIIRYTNADLTHVMGLSVDGVTGMSPIRAHRNSIGTGIAGDNAAGRMFANGLMLGGLLTTDMEIDETQAEKIKSGLRKKSGSDNAGDIALLQGGFKFAPWTMPAKDAQFIESRGYQINEVCRIYRMPKILLAEDGASTWGSGIDSLLLAYQKFTLNTWTTALEEALSTLINPGAKFVEFEYAGLLQGSPMEVTDNLVKQIEAGLLTEDEGRAILNRPPLTASQKEARKPPAPVAIPGDNTNQDNSGDS